jgi:hypothetical protein
LQIIRFNVESFRKRIKIIRSNGKVLDLSRIPPDLYQVYPGLKPLLDYILNPSEDANRKIFTKYVAGTEYFQGQLMKQCLLVDIIIHHFLVIPVIIE